MRFSRLLWTIIHVGRGSSLVLVVLAVIKTLAIMIEGRWPTTIELLLVVALVTWALLTYKPIYRPDIYVFIVATGVILGAFWLYWTPILYSLAFLVAMYTPYGRPWTDDDPELIEALKDSQAN